MFGWTLLLIWAYQKPLERRFVAFFTLLVVIGLAATEIISIMYGIISIGKIIPTIILQILIAVLFGFSFVNSRKTE